MSAEPQVALVVPLEDPRGDVVDHLRTWTDGQTLARERYQVLVGASGEHPDLERRVAGLLAPQDALASAPGASLMDLYDTAARAARAPVLVLTEAHCRAEPRCLESVGRAFAADPDLDAVTFEHRQSARTPVGELTERWFARVFRAWDRAEWKRLSPAGVAIRAEAYVRAGGLDPRLGLFAPSYMSARLHDVGGRVGTLDDVLLTHEVEEGMAHSLALSGSFAHGECLARRDDPAFVERYFGPAGLWERRLAYRGDVARATVAALASEVGRGPRPWLMRELAARVPAACAGAAPRLAWERAGARWHRWVAGCPGLPAERRWRSYVAAHEGTVRATQLSCIARDGAGLPPPATDGAVTADRLDGSLVGAHGLEHASGRTFRWTEPVALLRLAPPAQGGVLRVDTGGLRGSPLDYLHRIYAGARRLARDRITGDAQTLVAHLPAGFARAARDAGIVLVCDPLVPNRAGSSDRRRLGMPVVAVHLAAA